MAMEWALEHPWMTLFLALSALAVLDSVVANVARALSRNKE
jgi:hypothetical protein